MHTSHSRMLSTPHGYKHSKHTARRTAAPCSRQGDRRHLPPSNLIGQHSRSEQKSVTKEDSIERGATSMAQEEARRAATVMNVTESKRGETALALFLLPPHRATPPHFDNAQGIASQHIANAPLRQHHCVPQFTVATSNQPRINQRNGNACCAYQAQSNTAQRKTENFTINPTSRQIWLVTAALRGISHTQHVAHQSASSNRRLRVCSAQLATLACRHDMLDKSNASSTVDLASLSRAKDTVLQEYMRSRRVNQRA
jgi:hypothetical protein